MGRKGWRLNVSKNRVERQGCNMILLVFETSQEQERNTVDMQINNCSLWSSEPRLMISRSMLESREESLMNLGWSYRTPEATWHWFWQKTNNKRTLNVRRWWKKDRFRSMCPVGKYLASFHFLNWPRFHRNLSNKCVNSWLEIEYCTHLKHFYPSVHFCIIYSTNLTVSHQDSFTHLQSASIFPTGLSCQNYPWDVLRMDFMIGRYLGLVTVVSYDYKIKIHPSVLWGVVSLCKCISIFFSWRVLDCVTKGLINHKSDLTEIHLTVQSGDVCSGSWW